MKKQFGKTDYAVGIAAIAALVGMVIYLITSMTGYLASAPMNFLPVISTAAALVMMAAILFAGTKMSGIAVDGLMLVSVALLLYSIYGFVLGRVALAADVYFIPVNYPASEATALHISIAGLVFYLVADIAMILAAFIKRPQEG